MVRPPPPVMYSYEDQLRDTMAFAMKEQDKSLAAVQKAHASAIRCDQVVKDFLKKLDEGTDAQDLLCCFHNIAEKEGWINKPIDEPSDEPNDETPCTAKFLEDAHVAVMAFVNKISDKIEDLLFPEEEEEEEDEARKAVVSPRGRRC